MTLQEKIIEILQEYVDFSAYKAEKEILNSIAEKIIDLKSESQSVEREQITSK